MSLATFVDVDAARRSFEQNDFELKVEGVRTWKLPDDLMRYRRVVDLGQPEVVVECGTAWGGSALWFASLGLDVVTVDVNGARPRPARSLPGAERVTWVVGGSLKPVVAARVAAAVAGRRVMVVLDSDHHASHVAAEIRLYAPLVSQGCYLVVEDGIFDLMGAAGARGGRRIPAEGGPLAAVRQTVAQDPRWWRDVDVERLTPVTHSPAGWWRRHG